MKKIILFFLMACTAKLLWSQDSTKVKLVIKKEKQVCFNMTPMLSQFIPFNNIDPFLTGPVNIALKSFTNDIAYRFGAGVNLNTSGNDNQHFNIRNGYEIRKHINEKWNYSHGCDALLSMGNLNLPGSVREQDNVLIGLAPFWSIEFCCGKYLSISTETSLLIGYQSGFEEGLRIQFIPPIALYLNLKH